jgi:ArsR family transcriptional regulator, arsenate/arsenite/antimonite-responsive transcriptional repressor / arsenate reductase (thioredoxin)
MYCRIVAIVQTAGTAEPLSFLRAVDHPLRWRLLGELARSDRQVHELTALVRQPQNLVSYHLGQLRRAGLVTSRRSAADARDSYYRADLSRCGRLLAGVGAALHPGLRLAPPPAPALPPASSRPASPAFPAASAPVSVLFLCTGNSSRSQIAEALLRRRAGAGVRVRSAGSHPRPLHPDAVAVMAERGIDISGARPKHLDEFANDRFDNVITLCDRVREVCPEFPGITSHWSIPDPAREPDGRPAFERLIDDLEDRIGFLVHRIADPSILEAP